MSEALPKPCSSLRLFMAKQIHFPCIVGRTGDGLYEAWLEATRHLGWSCAVVATSTSDTKKSDKSMHTAWGTQNI